MAYVEAISNGGSGLTAARSNAIRSGYFDRARVVVAVNGTQRKALKADLSIHVPTGREPATADVVFKGSGGFVPDRGQTLVLGHGTVANRLFNGRIIRAERQVVRHVEPKPTYRIEAVDRLFDLARAYCPAGLVAQSIGAASLVRGLLASATPSTTSLGFAATYVQPDMATIAEFVVSPTESVVEAFDRLALAIGATWYSDEHQHVHYWTDVDPQVKPTIGTLTASSATYFHLRRVTEMGRVFSRVVGEGTTTTLSHDVLASETVVPVDDASLLVDVRSVFDLQVYYGTTSGRVTVNGVPRSVVSGRFPSDLLTQAALLTAAPASKTSDSYWVAEVVSDSNLYSDPFMDRRWVGVNGDYFRVSSTTGFSSSANTLYSRIFVPSSGPGAPNPTDLGAVPAGTRFQGERWELVLSAASLTGTVPKGAAVRAYYDVSSTALVNAISSLCGDVAPGLSTDIVNDPSLRPAELVKACQARLHESHPDRWTTYTMETRDPAFTRGQTVHLSVLSPGESGGPSLTGTYPIQAITIGSFEETADSKGPLRSVMLGPTTKPSLFLEWSRWNV